MTVEELEQRLRETFFYTDEIDESVYLELERLRAALEEKDPRAFSPTAEEFWERFRREHGEELDRCRAGAAGNTAARKPARRRGLMRSVLIAAVVMVLLAGAALAADSLGLWAWAQGWSGAPGRYAQTGSGTPGPILEALEELGITEPVYPSWLPMDYELTEAHISQDPMLLYELYTRGDRYISITVTPISVLDTALHPQEYRSGETGHYLFSNGGSITAVWYTENYYTAISSNITARAMQRIIDSVSGE